MALKKTIPNQFGSNTTYWKIVDVNTNNLVNSAHVTLCGWVNKQARVDGKQPTDQRSYDWGNADFPFTTEELDKLGNNAVKLSYNNIKSLTIVTPGIEPETPDTITPGEFSDALED